MINEKSKPHGNTKENFLLAYIYSLCYLLTHLIDAFFFEKSHQHCSNT